VNKKNRHKNIKLFLQLIIVVVIVLLSVTIKDDKLSVKFYSCVDGDTAKFITNKGVETVRFLAIDTPETVHPTKDIESYGKEASEYTCSRLTNAETIELEFDINSDKYDKYNRLLAWIFVDGKLLQSELVNVGYAKVAYLYGDYKYTTILINKETIAKQKELGIWYNK
jgi:micrococcal nuclease